MRIAPLAIAIIICNIRCSNEPSPEPRAVTKYYVSQSAGSDANAGTSASTPWKTLAKANSFVTVAGDSILLKRGDKWTEVLRPKSNSVGIGAYGSGAAPLLTGFITLTGWTQVSTNIWKCPAPGVKNWVNMLIMNDVPMPIGHSDWMTYTSSNLNQVVSASITKTWIGTEVVVRKSQFYAEKGKVTSQSGTTIGYINTKALDGGGYVGFVNGKTGYSFFFQRYKESLTERGEWFYDTVAKEMNVYSAANPNTLVVKTAVMDTIVVLANHTGIGIRDLTIEGANQYGVEGYAGTNLSVVNCTIRYCTKGVYMWNVKNVIVDGNRIDNSFNEGIMCSNRQSTMITIQNNIVDSTGLMMGNGIFSSAYNLNGISAEGTSNQTANFTKVIGNTVTNSGYIGIHHLSCNEIIRRNIVDRYCSILDDGGGIYTYTASGKINVNIFYNRRVDSNFVSNGIGALAGRPGDKPDIVGIYGDEQTSRVAYQYNVIYNVDGPGIQLNTPTYDTLRYNTIYNCTALLNINKYEYDTLHANYVMYNTMYQKTNLQHVLSYSNNGVDQQGGIPITTAIQRIADMDNNWLSNLKTESYTWYYADKYSLGWTAANTHFGLLATLSVWRATYHHEEHSILSPLPLTNTNTSLVINATNNIVPYKFQGLSKKDPKGNTYDNAFNMPRWSGTILIDNGNSTVNNILPVANAGNDQTVNLPANTARLDGSASNDPDGTINAWQWKEGTAVLGTSPVLNLSGLTVGDHTYVLTVTDNIGGIGTDDVKVSVVAAPVKDTARPTIIAWPIK